MFANVAKLVDTREATQNDMIIDDDVTCESRIVGEYRMITDQTIMSNMNICHDPVIITKAGNASPWSCTTINGAKLPDDIIVSYFECGFVFALVFFILGIIADRTKLKNFVIFPDFCLPIYNDMRAYPATFIDFDIGAN